MVLFREYNPWIKNGLRTVPFIAAPMMQKSASRYARSGFSSTVTKRKRQSGRHGLKAVIQSVKPAKHSYVADSDNNVANMTHNTIYSFSPTQVIPQSVGEYSRTGNSIQLEALKINLWYMNPTGTSNGVKVRIIVLFSDVNTARTTFGSALGISDLFGIGSGASTGTSFTTGGIIDPKRVTVVDDRSFTVAPSVTTVRESPPLAYTVPLHQKFVYDPIGAYGKFKNLYVCVVACVPDGTSGATNVGSIYSNTDLIFKDN